MDPLGREELCTTHMNVGRWKTKLEIKLDFVGGVKHTLQLKKLKNIA